jgi:hypothetical protein
MKDYTSQQLEEMEQEAIQQLKEMQQRAHRTAQQQGWTGSTPQPPADQPPADPPPAAPSPAEAAPAPNPPLEQEANPLGSLMQRLGGERGILLGLLALLMGEGADPTLLLALFYLAMYDGSSETN